MATATARPEERHGADGRRLVAAWLVLSAIATPLVAIYVGPRIPPGNATAQAAQQTTDNTWLVSIMTPVALLVLLLLGWAVIAFRSRTTEVVDGLPVRGDGRIQITWIVATSITVLFLAVFGTYELAQSGSGGGQGPTAAFVPSGSSKAMDVQVIAQQWEFTYRYPTYGGVEVPHLVLPAHTLIRLHVTSLDAIHSFWAYQLGVKADANPGVDNIVYLQTKGTRTFEIHCAELCGLWHGYMFDTGQVVDSPAFAAWMKQQRAYFRPVEKYLPAYATSYLPDPARRAG
jgi:cytochrome c oxidase subunit 2